LTNISCEEKECIYNSSDGCRAKEIFIRERLMKLYDIKTTTQVIHLSFCETMKLEEVR